MPQFQAKPPVGVVFDTGMSRIDDALAMSLLYGFDGKNEVRLVALTVSRSNLKAAAYCELVGQFYAGAVSGAYNAVGRTLPVGMTIGGKLSGDLPFFTAPFERKDAEGKPA